MPRREDKGVCDRTEHGLQMEQEELAKLAPKDAHPDYLRGLKLLKEEEEEKTKKKWERCNESTRELGQDPGQEEGDYEEG